MASLSVKQLKEILDEAGANYDDCLSKEDLFKRLSEVRARAAGRERTSSPDPPPSRPSRPYSPPPPRSSSSSSRSSSSTSSPRPKPKPFSSSSSSSTPSSSSGANYTDAQQTLAKRVLASKSHYSSLGVATNASESEIKTAYRKMSLKLHPDKNKAPEAEEAFKVVSAAYQCLKDARKRNNYDQSGQDNASRFATDEGQAQSHFRRRGYRQEMNPQDIFEAFFGGQFHQQQRHSRHRRQRRSRRESDDEGEGNSGLGQLFGFLPFLLLLLFSVLSNFGSVGEQEVFGLAPTKVFTVPRTTSLDTPFYVSAPFQRRHGNNPQRMNQVENMADQAYFNNLEQECAREKKEKGKRIEEAVGYNGNGKAKKLHAAYAIQQPSCAKWHNLGIAIREQ